MSVWSWMMLAYLLSCCIGTVLLCAAFDAVCPPEDDEGGEDW